MRVYLAAPGNLYSDPKVRFTSHRLLTSFVKPSWTAERLEKAIKAANPRDGYCVDSGAHVWISSFMKTGQMPPRDQVERHLTNFVEHVQRLKQKPSFVVELDLQRIFGMSTIDAWRRDIWMPLEAKTGIRVCYVWQPTDGEATWRAMLSDDRMRYLGMGGAQSGEKVIKNEQRAHMIYRAYEAAKPVHGFAAVRGRWLRTVPFFSVDSTSWAAGTFFGLIPSFNAADGRLSQRSVGRTTFKEQPKLVLGRLAKAKSRISVSTLSERSNGKDFSAFYQQAAGVYEQFEAWYTSYWRARGLDWEGRLAAAGNLPPG